MTLLYYNPLFLEHLTGNHPERPERLTHVMRHLQRTGLDVACVRPQWQSLSRGRVDRVHSAGYIDSVQKFVQAGGGRIEEDTVCSPRSLDAALLAAGAVVDATVRVVSNEAANALCLVRPPGHHALKDAAMGFCLINNVAAAARVALDELGLERVLIVDWDVHHGNGTQALFWEDPQVAFFSIHRWPFYPGTGDSDETGAGRGLGTTQNLPIPFGTSRTAYLEKFRTNLENFAARVRPQLVILSAGFDSHRDDPIGSLELETEDFVPLTQTVLEIANVHCNGRVVSVLEGGYNTGALAGSVEAHLQALLAAKSNP